MDGLSQIQTDTAGQSRVRPRELRVLLSECWFALRLVLWLCLLTISLRFRPLPELLRHLSRVRRLEGRSPLEIERAVHIVVTICRLRPFHLPLFPRSCLRQSLALYRVLIRLSHPVAIHFGIHRKGEGLQGHSWVTIHGKPVAEKTPTEIFRTVYSYPPAPNRSFTDGPSQFQESESIENRR
jgi:Transglutaminase-like superfamily